MNTILKYAIKFWGLSVHLGSIYLALLKKTKCVPKYASILEKKL